MFKKDLSVSSNKFRNPNGGRRLTKGLFFELVMADKTGVLYTLKENDHEGYPSLHRLYLLEADPTEWSFANKYLESFSHWEELCECNWFKKYVLQWRKELELKIKSAALGRVFEESLHPESKSYYHANKFLLEGGWVDKESKHGRGRPSKDEIKKAAFDAANDQGLIDEDYDRLVSGGASTH